MKLLYHFQQSATIILWSTSTCCSIYIYIRGVSDVGFSIFADTDADADFAF